MIVFADLHLKPSTADIVFGEVLPGIEQAADKHGGPITCLGDLFHIRYQVDVRIFNQLRDVISGWAAKYEVLLLPGNHDQYDLQGRNILESLGDIEGVTVFTAPACNEWGAWVPYRKNLEEVVQSICWARENNTSDPRVLFLHQEMIGALMNNHLASDYGLSAADLKRWDVVFLGHWHAMQWVCEDPTVMYVGSAYQTKADELGQQKGFVHWDPKLDQRPVFHLRDWGPKYHNISVVSGEQVDLKHISTGDIVRVTATAGVDVQELSKSLEGTRHSISIEEPQLEQRLDVGPSASLFEYAREYVNLKVEDTEQRGVLIAQFQRWLEESHG